MIVKHSADETSKPMPVGLRLARVISIGNGTVDVCPIGSSVVLHDIPVTSATTMEVGDVVNLQMMDNKRFAFASQNAVVSGESTSAGNITIQNGDTFISEEGGSGSGTITSVIGGLGLTGYGAAGAVTLNVGQGDGIVVSGDSIAVSADVVRTSRSVFTGSGLTGGGNLSADRTLSINLAAASGLNTTSGLAVGQGNGISVGTSSVAVNQAYGFVWTSTHRFSVGLNVGNITGAAFGNLNVSGNVNIKASDSGYDLNVNGATYSSSQIVSPQIITQVLRPFDSFNPNIYIDVGTNLSSYSYSSGFAGSGWKITQSQKSSFEVDNLTVRGTLSVYELLIQQIRATNGSVFVSAAAKIESVTGTGPYTLIVEGGSSDIAPFAVGDVLRAQRVSLGTSTLVWQSDLTVTEISVGGNTRAFTASLRIGSTAPAAGMEYVRLGNTTDTNRQGAVYLTADDSGAPFIDIVNDVISHAGWGTAAKVKARIGRLNGIVGGATANYGIWAGTGTTSTDSWVKMAEDGILLNNVPLKMYNSTLQTVDFAANGNLKIGTNVANASTTALSWNGSTLSVKGSVEITGGSGWESLTDKPVSIYDINSAEHGFLTTSSRMVFSETFSDVGGALSSNRISNWEVVSSVAGYSLSIVNIADSSMTGGSVLRATKGVRLIHKTLIPYSPKKLYRSRVVLRRQTNSVHADGSYVTLGFIGIASDGVTSISPLGTAIVIVPGVTTIINSHNHITVAQQPTVANSWITYTGYTSGSASTGTNTGDATTNPTSISNPGEMHTNVRYLRPFMQLNHASPDGVIDVDSFIVESYDIPSDSGLYMSPKNLGFWDGSNWKAYMNNSGQFYLGGTNGTSSSLTWNGTTLSIKGSVEITGGSGYANITDKPDSIYDINQSEYVSSASSSHSVFSETFSGPTGTSADDEKILGSWTATSNSTAPQIIRTGSNSLQTGGAVYRAVGQIRLVSKKLIPFDPKKIYRGTVVVKGYTQSGPTYYYSSFGYVGYAEDGVTVIYSNDLGAGHQHINGSVVLPGTWTKYVGYTSGYATAGTNGTGTASTPAKMREGVRYIRPTMVLNNATTTGTVYVDSFVVESFDLESDAGLYMNPEYMGYYGGAASGWKTYMDNLGNFYLGGSSGGSLSWTSSSNSLNISGSINLKGSIHANPAVAGLYGDAGRLGYHDGTSYLTHISNDGIFLKIAEDGTGYVSKSGYKFYRDGITTLPSGLFMNESSSAGTSRDLYLFNANPVVNGTTGTATITYIESIAGAQSGSGANSSAISLTSRTVASNSNTVFSSTNALTFGDPHLNSLTFSKIFMTSGKQNNDEQGQISISVHQPGAGSPKGKFTINAQSASITNSNTSVQFTSANNNDVLLSLSQGITTSGAGAFLGFTGAVNVISSASVGSYAGKIRIKVGAGYYWIPYYN